MPLVLLLLMGLLAHPLSHCLHYLCWVTDSLIFDYVRDYFQGTAQRLLYWFSGVAHLFNQLRYCLQCSLNTQLLLHKWHTCILNNNL